MKRRAFSLVEILIGTGLVAVLLATVNVFLFTSLRSAKKAESVSVTKAEGAFAIDAMTDTIKYSRRIVGFCNNVNSLQVEKLGGQVVEYSLSGGRLASSSGTITAYLTSTAVVAQVCAGRPAVFNCPVDKGSVSLCFDLARSGSTSSEDSARATFETTVKLRNIDN